MELVFTCFYLFIYFYIKKYKIALITKISIYKYLKPKSVISKQKQNKKLYIFYSKKKVLLNLIIRLLVFEDVMVTYVIICLLIDI